MISTGCIGIVWNRDTTRDLMSPVGGVNDDLDCIHQQAMEPVRLVKEEIPRGGGDDLDHDCFSITCNTRAPGEERRAIWEMPNIP